MQAFIDRVRAGEFVLPDVDRLRTGSDEDRSEWLYEGFGDPVVQALDCLAALHEALRGGWTTATTGSFLNALDQLRAEQTTADRVAGIAWSWHVKLRRVYRPYMTTAVVCDIFALSWLGCMSGFLLQHIFRSMLEEQGVFDEWPSDVALRADENLYVRYLMGAGRSNVVISTDLIGNYTLREWQYALYALREAIHDTGWTPNAGQYLRALVLRYAMVLTRGENEPERIFDHPRLCRSERRQPQPQPLLLLLPRRLNMAAIFAMERPLFFAMRHQIAANAFFQAARGEWHPRPREWRHAAWRACKEFVHSMASHPTLRFDVMEVTREHFAGAFTMPGECEEIGVAHQLPAGKVVDPDTALYESRRDVFMALQTVQKDGVSSLLERWVDEAIKRDSTHGEELESCWDTVAACRPTTFERPAVMSLLHVLNLWLLSLKERDFSVTAQCFFDDNSVQPPADAPPMTPAAAVAACRGRRPCLVTINMLYAVVAVNDTVTVSPHFVEALSTLLTDAIECRRLRTDSIEATALRHLIRR